LIPIRCCFTAIGLFLLHFDAIDWTLFRADATAFTKIKIEVNIFAIPAYGSIGTKDPANETACALFFITNWSFVPPVASLVFGGTLPSDASGGDIF
jgi:hypothetical protein